MKLHEQEFKDWSFVEIEVKVGELPLRVYYKNNEHDFLLFFIVELHATEVSDDNSDIEDWDIMHSEVSVVGKGNINRHKSLWVNILSDYTSSCSNYAKVFKFLSQYEE